MDDYDRRGREFEFKNLDRELGYAVEEGKSDSPSTTGVGLTTTMMAMKNMSTMRNTVEGFPLCVNNIIVSVNNLQMAKWEGDTKKFVDAQLRTRGN